MQMPEMTRIPGFEGVTIVEEVPELLYYMRLSTLDIDILTYDQCVGLVDGVALPRGEILFNAFVLWPLAEIAPDELHPLAALSYGELWQNYEHNRQALWPVSFHWRGSELTRFPTRLAEGL